jgi:AcrR family transcriptional regulator
MTVFEQDWAEKRAGMDGQRRSIATPGSATAGAVPLRRDRPVARSNGKSGRRPLKVMPPPRRRLSPEERRAHLIEEAISYFSEVGFDGSTRELAKRMGVTQPLLYRYFPTKDDLIRAVYNAVFINRWRPEWQVLLEDRSKPLAERLKTFYRSYSEVAFTREWLRIYLFSGLKGVEINRRYISLLRERVLTTIIRELYADCGRPQKPDFRPGMKELELAWTLHVAVFYYAVRQHIYQIPVLEDRGAMIDQNVTLFMRGARELIDT